MDKYFNVREHQSDTRLYKGFLRNGLKDSKACWGKYGSANPRGERFESPLQILQNDFDRCKAKIGEQIMKDLKRKYLTSKMRKLMATELCKSYFKGDLKQVVAQITNQVCDDDSKSKEFLILGGGPRSLPYSRNKLLKKADGSVKSFRIEVDVRGYMPNNVLIDTEDNRMSIRAVKVNGSERGLGIVAPSISILEQLKVHAPTKGILCLEYP